MRGINRLLILNKSLLFSSEMLFCNKSDRLALLNSQYHLRGLLPLKESKEIERLLKDKNALLNSKIRDLETQRKKLQKRTSKMDSIASYGREKKEMQMQEYLKKYEQFKGILRNCQLNNEWIYKTMGWYNITQYYKPLLMRLLQSRDVESQYLIDALSWMKYQWKNPYGLIDEELRQKKKIQKFYKQLNQNIHIEYLKKLEKILITPLVFSKRRYFQNYISNKIQNYTKTVTPQDEEGVNNIIWLFEAFIINRNDHDFLISKFQRCLLSTKLNLSSDNLQRLINIYTLKGRINKNIYNEYLKPYLTRKKMNNLQNIIEAIKFTICSESEDNLILKQLYQLIEVNYQYGKLTSSQYKYDLHVYTHYLRIKGYKIKLNPTLERELVNFCKQKAEGRLSVNRILYDGKIFRQNIAKKKVNEFSQCLDIKESKLKQFDSTQLSVFEQIFKFKLSQLKISEMKIYQKAIFCCFELDFCLHKQSTNELIDIQIDGLQYVFQSGRMIRSREIKDEILAHYGFKINHIDYNSFKSKSKIRENQLLMDNSTFFENK